MAFHHVFKIFVTQAAELWRTQSSLEKMCELVPTFLLDMRLASAKLCWETIKWMDVKPSLSFLLGNVDLNFNKQTHMKKPPKNCIYLFVCLFIYFSNGQELPL